ncbi:hypothetical protein N752_15550 [Desulforamulus aquiferis]|nr:hypothetical protein N752_15550 [Desulforamulus aquiferis]
MGLFNKLKYIFGQNAKKPDTNKKILPIALN